MDHITRAARTFFNNVTRSIMQVNNEELYNEELYNAIQNGDLNSFKQVLGNGTGINAFDQEGYTPLMCICNIYNISEQEQPSLREMAKLLIMQRNININAQSKALIYKETEEEFTPEPIDFIPITEDNIFPGYTIINGSLRMVHRGRDDGQLYTRIDIETERWYRLVPGSLTYVNTGIMYKNTALHIACAMGIADIIEILLEHKGIDIDILNHASKKPESYINDRPNVKIKKCFREFYKKKLFHAIQNVDLENFKHYYKNVEEGGSYSDNTLVNVSTLYEGERDYTSLMKDCTPLMYVLFMHSISQIAQKQTLRHMAELLIKYNNVNINAQNSDGNTALHIACKTSNKDLIQILLKHPNIDILCVNNEWKKPEDYIEDVSNLDSFQEFKERKLSDSVICADLENFQKYYKHVKLNKLGHKLLLCLLSRYNLKLYRTSERRKIRTIAELLLQSSNIDINAQNSDGDTALHIACKIGDEEIVSNILKYQNINIFLVNRIGEKPENYIKEKQAIWQHFENFKRKKLNYRKRYETLDKPIISAFLLINSVILSIIITAPIIPTSSYCISATDILLNFAMGYYLVTNKRETDRDNRRNCGVSSAFFAAKLMLAMSFCSASSELEISHSSLINCNLGITAFAITLCCIIFCVQEKASLIGPLENIHQPSCITEERQLY